MSFSFFSETNAMLALQALPVMAKLVKGKNKMYRPTFPEVNDSYIDVKPVSFASLD